MKRSTRIRIGLTSFTLIAILIAGFISVRAEQETAAHSLGIKPADVLSNTAVTTYHNDNQRTGQNINETILNTSNVNAGQFGKRVAFPVDGQVAAQPLFVPNLAIKGVNYNVVFVTTENDSIYAFDADQTSTTTPLWQTSFLINGATPVPSSDIYSKYPYQDITPQVGITGTPVIDLVTKTLYLSAMTKENGQYFHRIHALDMFTGKDKAGSPIVVQASVPGTGYDSNQGVVSFNSMEQNQRPALLLSRGVIYVSWGAYGDTDPYHGWVIGYTYNGKAFKQVSVYNDSANGQEAGIWMSGSGPATDANGYIYLTTGNGSHDESNGTFGNSFVKLDPRNGLSQYDHFTPFNEICLDGRDADLGSAGLVLLPDQPNTAHPHLILGSGKEGRVFVIDRDHMGKFVVDPNLQCNTNEENRTDIDKIVQELPGGTAGNIFGAPAYWAGTANSGPFAYFGGYNGPLKAFQVGNNSISTNATSASAQTFGFSGATPSISSNGNTDGTGIVWVVGPSNCTFPGCTPSGPGSLHAYDATNLANELYNSDQNANRDQLGSYMKFSLPTIANGEVFVGTRGYLNIYGLLGTQSSPSTVFDDSVQGAAQNQFNYVGNWGHCMNCNDKQEGMYRASNSWSKNANDSATFAFTGTQASLYGVKRPSNGIAAISIDGGNETNIDFYGQNDSGDQQLWLSPILTAGPHTLKIRVTGTNHAPSTDNFVCIDRVDINS